MLCELSLLYPEIPLYILAIPGADSLMYTYMYVYKGLVMILGAFWECFKFLSNFQLCRADIKADDAKFRSNKISLLSQINWSEYLEATITPLTVINIQLLHKLGR